VVVDEQWSRRRGVSRHVKACGQRAGRAGDDAVVLLERQTRTDGHPSQPPRELLAQLGDRQGAGRDGVAGGEAGQEPRVGLEAVGVRRERAGKRRLRTWRQGEERPRQHGEEAVARGHRRRSMPGGARACRGGSGRGGRGGDPGGGLTARLPSA
jgi:hypothetical protein